MKNALKKRVNPFDRVMLAVILVLALAAVIFTIFRLNKPVVPPQLDIYTDPTNKYCVHWIYGDSQYDADAQAKLIALTNISFDTDDRYLLQAIGNKAHAVREAARTVYDDALTDAAAVQPLSRALDSAVLDGNLTKEELFALEKPYIEISPAGEGTAATRYSFGNVDIIIAVPSKALNPDGSLNDLPITVKASYKAYVIYLDDWKDDCADAVRALEASGIPPSDIGSVAITSNDGFVEAWNSISLTSGGLDVPWVIIDTHATPALLDGPGLTIPSDFILTFEKKHIEKLILLGCNAGHADFEETNPAASFSEIINGGFVLASDGTVFNIGADKDGFSQYESKNDDAFQSYKGTDGRDCLGWIVYQALGDGAVETYDTHIHTYTLPDIMRYFGRTWF